MSFQYVCLCPEQTRFYVQCCECVSVYLAATGIHFVYGSDESRVAGLDELNLSSDIGLRVGAHQEVVLTPFLTGQTSFRLDHSVDPPN